jgi:hypothetical protein
MIKKILIILACVAIGAIVYTAFTNDTDSVKTEIIGVVDGLKADIDAADD